MKKKSGDVIAFNIISYTLMTVFVLACIIPFYLIIVGSFTSDHAIITEGYSLLPDLSSFSVEGYKTVFENPVSILRSYGVTITVTLIGTSMAILLTTMTGYVLSRQDFESRNVVSFVFFFTTLFNGGLVPWYLLCSNYLGFSNQLYSMILPGMFSVWNMIIAKSFMKGIPYEMVEAAKMDGAGDFRIYYQIMLPMAKPLIATIGLFIALAYWNDWYNCMLFIKDENLYSLQYSLQNMLNSSEALKRIAALTGRQVQTLPTESTKMAMTIVTTGPIIFLYPFLQKYFVKGLTIGAVKG